jgi:hypothetical protein
MICSSENLLLRMSVSNRNGLYLKPRAFKGSRSFANPYDPDAVAEALQTALLMPIEERRERWRAMMEILRRHSITAWRESFLRALSG